MNPREQQYGEHNQQVSVASRATVATDHEEGDQRTDNYGRRFENCPGNGGPIAKHAYVSKYGEECEADTNYNDRKGSRFESRHSAIVGGP